MLHRENMGMDDPNFTALSTRLRRRIDDAFDSAAGIVSKPSSPPRKKHKPDPGPSSGLAAVDDVLPGGFLLEDAGGFLLPEYDGHTASPKPLSIPLSSIPTALELLGLPPDDEEVLAVFQNAASGWGKSSDGSRNVSRKDWRAVCAALLEGEDEGESSNDRLSPFHSENAVPNDEEDDSGTDGDEYRMSIDGDTSEPEASDEEYQDDKPASRTTLNRSRSELNAKLDPGQLSAKQRAGCREDFARFFPDMPDEQLDSQKIMIKDVTRVANLLKEKIKAEEVRPPYSFELLVNAIFPQIIEMLEAFSTSPDKSMNLQDFERMMIATKLMR